MNTANNLNITRGSEWHRWELHLHTPCTQKEDRYIGKDSDEKWNKFYSDIDKYIGDGTNPLKSIYAIAITDYLSIDNYLKVIKDDKLPPSVQFVLPNVELRMMPIAKSSPVNIHCLFDPKIADDLENRFFAKLKFEYNESSYSATKQELIRFGRDFLRDTSIDESEALKTGINQYVISYDVLSAIFKNDRELRKNTLIIVSNSSGDGVSGLNSHSDYFIGKNISQLEANRRLIYQFSDMIFSANPKDVAYFLGEGVDNPDVVKEKCGGLMPCVHGCDAHGNEKIFSPNEDRFCWIKAEATFEGLKQIIYEPKERVRISSTIPDEKKDYYVIDRVEIDNNELFAKTPILFNDKLTCIIGGKSTGKSLLLHNIAKAIDADQVQKKEKDAPTNVREITGFQVFWRDGVSGSEKNQERKIVYIPQTYLNRLSDDEQETTEIDRIIQNIILQNKKCFELYKVLNQQLSENKQAIAKTIVDFIKIDKDMKEIMNECKEIGKQEIISNEIKKLKNELQQLSVLYNVNDEERGKYQSSVEKIQTLGQKKRNVLKERGMIQEISSLVEMRKINNYEITIYYEQLQEIMEEIQKCANTIWEEKKKEIIEDADLKLGQIQKELIENKTIVESLKSKMEGNVQIAEVSVKLSEEQKKLLKLNELCNRLAKFKESYKEKLQILSNTFESFEKIYSEYIDGINSIVSSSNKELEFSLNKVFRIKQFSQKVLSILNNRSLNKFNLIDLQKIDESFLHTDLISDFINSLISDSNESLQIKASYTVESALRELMDDWYNINYVVKLDGDGIQDMSPGKKALVLLRLLLDLAESKYPILIDQPEDDLDNRSIFSELIDVIKKKKIDRQIIIATHNANVVLGGDAELVIVANQDGKNAPNEAYRFEYRGGAIEDVLPVYDDVGNIRSGILNQKGVQKHICEILEGGETAFALRQHKYHFK